MAYKLSVSILSRLTQLKFFIISLTDIQGKKMTKLNGINSVRDSFLNIEKLFGIILGLDLVNFVM